MQEVSEYHRYCPDQPKVLISDAVCLGRRRGHYPQCPGCQFNDGRHEGLGDGSNQSAARTEDAIQKVFVGFDIHARYPEDLNEEVAWRIGHASASYLRGSLRGLDRSDPIAATVIMGRDGRSSSPALSEAASEGARSTGTNVVDLGLVDSPQLNFAVNHLRACGGIYTTGSHAPAEYNGFKVVAQGGGAVAPDAGLVDIMRIAQNMVKHDTGQEGAFRTLDLTGEYRSFLRGHLRKTRPMKVVLDASNGMAGKWLPIVLDGVPDLETVYLNEDYEAGFAHPPDPLADANLKQLRAKVRKLGADFGACFDGDAGRVVLVDEKASVVRSDMLTALLAGQCLEQYPGSTIVYDLRCSRVVAEEIKKAGGVPRRERVGQPFIKKALSESKGAFGGGLGGRFYFRESFGCDSAVLALMQVMNLLSRGSKPLSGLVRPLLRYAGSGQRFLETSEPDAVIRALAGTYSDARVDFLDGITVQEKEWWFNLRKSITSAEPALGLIVEAVTKELMHQKVEEVSARVAARTGT